MIWGAAGTTGIVGFSSGKFPPIQEVAKSILLIDDIL